MDGVEKLKKQSRGKFDADEYLPLPLRSSGAKGANGANGTPPLAATTTPLPTEPGVGVTNQTTPVLTRGTTLKVHSIFRALSFQTPTQTQTPPPSIPRTNENVTPGTARAASGGGVEAAGGEGSIGAKSDANPLRESTGSTDTSPFSHASGSKNNDGSPKDSGSVGRAEGLQLESTKNKKGEEDVAASGVFARGSLT